MSYAESLDILLEMFPTLSRDVVETVLRDHGGNIQTATEALLVLSGDDHAQSVWQDEELARAMQAQLDAEAGRTGSTSWLQDNARDASEADPAVPANSLWDQGAEDPFKEWRDVAESVGQTLSDGYNLVTETLSSWLSAPFEDTEEQDTRQRPGSSRDALNGDELGDRGAVITGGEGSSQAPLHRRAQLKESARPRQPATGVTSCDDDWDDGSSKKDK